jgi:hypothetical protein
MRRILTALAVATTAVMLIPASAWAIDARFLNGRWDGSYTCNDQETFLSLELDGDREGNVTGSFRFGPFGDNPGAEGSYEITGEINQTWFLELRGSGWIDQPEGYRMVDLRGVVQQGGVYSGTVFDAACTSFYVKRR